MTCGCLKPNECHHTNADGSCADILLSDVERAAGASGIGVGEAANNIPRTLRQATGQSTAESFSALLNRPVLVFDIDNTLADLSSAVAVALNASFNTTYKVEDFGTYSLAESLPLPQAAWLNLQINNGAFYPNLSPIEGGVHTIQRAYAAGYTVNIATDRPDSTQGVTVEWLDRFGIPCDNLWMRPNYTATSKLSYLASLDTADTVLIDDNPGHLIAWSRMGGQAWSPSWPYSPDDPGVRVFTDWHQPRRWLGI